MASLTDLFGPGRGTIRHQPAVKHVLGKAAPPASAYEADARRLLTLVWPSVRQMVPTAEERKNGLWSMGPFERVVEQANLVRDDLARRLGLDKPSTGDP